MLKSALSRLGPALLRRSADVQAASALHASALRDAGAAGGHPPAGAPTDDFENATGLELKELQEKAKGGDLFAQGFEWLDQARVRRNNLAHAAAAAFFSLRAQPNGTREKPVVVTSTLSSRIVGATDGDDDSIIHWGIVHEGQDPVKIGEEWFILKRNADGGAPGHH